nr:hypothetical protein [uncultured Clostridium sp.]
MNKNILLFCFLVLALTGCSGLRKNAAATEHLEKSQTASFAQESAAGTDQEDNWQTAYKDVISHGGGHLPDPYKLRGEDGWNSSVYLGIHDFNGDGIPELILGDGISLSVYTYENHGLKKVSDLYEPEGWYIINELYLQNNCLILVSNGSDGCGYVGFTCQNGAYITGKYDDYNPDRSYLNDAETTYKAFDDIFHITELEDNCKKSLIKRNGESGDLTGGWSDVKW